MEKIKESSKLYAIIDQVKEKILFLQSKNVSLEDKIVFLENQIFELNNFIDSLKKNIADKRSLLDESKDSEFLAKIILEELEDLIVLEVKLVQFSSVKAVSSGITC